MCGLGSNILTAGSLHIKSLRKKLKYPIQNLKSQWKFIWETWTVQNVRRGTESDIYIYYVDLCLKWTPRAPKHIWTLAKTFTRICDVIIFMLIVAKPVASSEYADYLRVPSPPMFSTGKSHAVTMPVNRQTTVRGRWYDFWTSLP